MAAQWAALTAPRPPLQLGERTIRLDQPQVMGIVNATPDSFSDGGQFADAAAAAEAGARHGGRGRGDHRRRRRIDAARRASPSGKATRSSASRPVIRQLAAGGAAVSADTRKADVMTAALEAGARMINDVSALTYDDRSAESRRGLRRAGRADAPPGRARDDAGRPALRRRAGRGLFVARGADSRSGRDAGHRARAHPDRSRASASARMSATTSS